MADQSHFLSPPLAYLNAEFMNTPAARPLRILAEYLEPADRLRRARIYDTIVFFGSARCLPPEEAARQLAAIDEQIDGSAPPSQEILQSRTRAEIGVKLARYYKDALELAR